MSLARTLYEAWRKPLPARGAGATFITLGTGAAALAAALIAGDTPLRPRLALSGIGLVIFMMGVARPRFAWEHDLGWRWVFGDRGFVLIYITLGLAGLIAAWTAPL